MGGRGGDGIIIVYGCVQPTSIKKCWVISFGKKIVWQEAGNQYKLLVKDEVKCAIGRKGRGMGSYLAMI